MAAEQNLSIEPVPPVERALVVTAHPDDVDFGAGGTVAHWVDQGTVVTYCVITDGDAGGFDPDVPRSQIPAIRRAEQIAAGESLGVADVRFLGYRDGSLTVTMGLRRDISRVIRQVRPERMLIQSPERNWQRIQASHPDHLAAGEAALCAIYPDARNPFAHTELLADEHAVDVTDFVDAKLTALRAHASQTAHMNDLDERIRGWLSGAAAQAGLPEGRYAETFQIIHIS